MDDEEGIRSIYVPILEKYAAFIFEASDGREAERIIRSEGIDLVILDLHMPIVNGMEPLNNIKDLNWGITIIIMTGSYEKNDIINAINLGVYDFLEKPLSFELFEHRIKKAVEKIDLQNSQAKILEYLLTELTNISLEKFYQMKTNERRKVLNAVLQLAKTKLIKKGSLAYG